MKKTHAAAAAIGSLLTLSALGLATTARAADDANMEKCYGIAKAGKNDCASAAHACAGQSKANASPKDFVNLPKGTCERLVHGKPATKA